VGRLERGRSRTTVASTRSDSHATATPTGCDHHPDLAEAEVALFDMKEPDDLAGGERDQRSIQAPVRRSTFDVDRRLGRDPVTFLCHCCEEERQRKTITMFRGPNLDGLGRHAPIFAEAVSHT
jgi:hypothetical protein